MLYSQATADERRGKTLRFTDPIDPRALKAASPLFVAWDLATVVKVLDEKFTARVVKEGTELLKEGDSGSAIYYVAAGNVGVTVTGKKQFYLGPGSMIGEISVVFLEACSATVTTVTPCDLWTARKQDILDVLLTQPTWFVKAKQKLNEKRAAWIPACPVVPFVGDQYLAYLPPPVAKQLAAIAKPRVVDASGIVITTGERCTEMFVLSSGVTEPQIPVGILQCSTILFDSNLLWTDLTVRAVTKCEIHFVPAADMWRFLKERHPKLYDRHFKMKRKTSRAAAATAKVAALAAGGSPAGSPHLAAAAAAGVGGGVVAPKDSQSLSGFEASPDLRPSSRHPSSPALSPGLNLTASDFTSPSPLLQVSAWASQFLSDSGIVITTGEKVHRNVRPVVEPQIPVGILQCSTILFDSNLLWTDLTVPAADMWRFLKERHPKLYDRHFKMKRK
eukprot:gene3021-4749_t